MNALDRATTSRRARIVSANEVPRRAPARGVVTRRATEQDTRAVEALIALRARVENESDEDAPPARLDQPERRMWVAFDGERAIGMTSLLARELRAGERC